ncbi:MAG: hypothetical protein QNJ73_14955, partial [Gammaproteobacteria bacterium]|nr:hypothetical protein [Gammaproteobacteria bacterium]
MTDIAHSRAIIAREGWPWLLGVIVLAIALWRLQVPLGAGIAAATAVLLFLLFRDPARSIPALPLGVLAPDPETTGTAELRWRRQSRRRAEPAGATGRW